MLNTIIKNIFQFILLILVQVLIIQNIQLGRFINPFIYVLFVLLLPFETPRIVLLLTSFALGLTIDMFNDTPGMHAAASVAIAFARPEILKIFSPRDGYEPEAKPTMHYLGTSWFLSYSSVLILLHHFILFFTEAFNFHEFFSTFFRVIMSSLFTLILVVTSQYFFYRKD